MSEAQHHGRVEDIPLLCGQGRFLDDLDPAGPTLSAAILRSPHPHALIRQVDLTRARSFPGVVAVIGPEEVRAGLRPFPLTTRVAMEYYPLAIDRVRYVGEPVAVVVAEDRYVAEDAADVVRVDYEPLPTVVTARSALDENASLLHPTAGTNVATDRTFVFGDPDERFEQADLVIDREFSFPRYSSTPMECYSVIAEWRDSGDGPEVTSWANFHGPFSMVPVLAGCLGIPVSRLRIIVPPDIGGGFGIKSAVYPYVALMALASKHAGHPVRWTEDRLEHLVGSSAGSDRAMRCQLALAEDGTFQALRVDLVDNVGAYLRPPEPSTLYRCFGNITGAYHIDAVQIRARAVVTNKTPTGLNRGFGGQQLYFGLERLVDEAAKDCQLDPAEIRRRNLIGADAFPYHTPTGGVYDSGEYHEAFERALKNVDYERLRAEQREARARGELVGIGIATIVDPSATNIGYVDLATPTEDRPPGRQKSGSTEHVRISVDPYGLVTVLLGSVPQGQGHATVARQVVADRLGLHHDNVRAVVSMDTESTPWTISSGSYSSRFAPLVTSALIEAADRIATTIRLAASVHLDVPADELKLAESQVRHRADADRALSFRHAAGLVHWDPGSLPAGATARLYEEAAFTPPQATAATRHDQINSSLCYGFGTEVVVCRIDVHTLEPSIELVSTVHDAGTILNPVLLEGQIRGALVHGLGGALYEELAYSGSGQPVTATFMDYLCPTAAEASFPLVSDHLETPSPVTALGAKGCGEGSSMSFPVAVANAVADALSALGVQVTSLPLHGSILHDLIGDRDDGGVPAPHPARAASSG